MKNAKRMLTLALAVLTLAALPAAGLATDAPADMEPAAMPAYMGVMAEVIEVNADNLLVMTEDGQELVLHTGEAWFVDNATGLPADAASIAAGDRIYCYHSMAVTMSLPAQTAAVCILTNVGERTPAHLLTVNEMTVLEDATVQLGCGDVILNVPAQTEVAPFRTRQILRATDLTAGTTLLAWYDMVALSLPARATADRVVVLDKPVLTVSVEAGDANGVVTVPLRECAEALGFTVEWNAAERCVELTNGVRRSTVTIGTDNYFFATAIPGMVGMSAPEALGCAPYIVAPGTTWVPADFFSLLGADVAAENGTVTITLA